MDNMMGGEGSQSLEYMHERMGYRYLLGLPIGMMGLGPQGYYGMPGYGGGYGPGPFRGNPFYYTNKITNNFWKGGPMMWNYGNGYGPGMMGWGFGWGGMLMGLIFLVVVILVIVFAVRAARGGYITGPASHETPLDILKKRYAKGEISKDDFERMKKDLQG